MVRREGARWTAAEAAAVFAVGLAVYLPALGNAFVNWDDDVYVTANARVRSLDGALLRYAFLRTDAANWHPLTWLSHAADWVLWGAGSSFLMRIPLHPRNRCNSRRLHPLPRRSARARCSKGGPYRSYPWSDW